MHLSSFGIISLRGSVTKPEPGLDFTAYQRAIANHTTALALRARLHRSAALSKIRSAPAHNLAPAPSAGPTRVSSYSTSALVRKFRMRNITSAAQS